MSFKENELFIQFFLNQKEYLFDIRKSESKEELAYEIESLIEDSYIKLKHLEDTDSTIRVSLIAHVFRSMSIDIDEIAEQVWERNKLLPEQSKY